MPELCIERSDALIHTVSLGVDVAPASRILGHASPMITLEFFESASGARPTMATNI
jgi:hypothetical protein